jgi:hypothetical protein
MLVDETVRQRKDGTRLYLGVSITVGYDDAGAITLPSADAHSRTFRPTCCPEHVFLSHA